MDDGKFLIDTEETPQTAADVAGENGGSGSDMGDVMIWSCIGLCVMMLLVAWADNVRVVPPIGGEDSPWIPVVVGVVWAALTVAALKTKTIGEAIFTFAVMFALSWFTADLTMRELHVLTAHTTPHWQVAEVRTLDGKWAEISVAPEAEQVYRVKLSKAEQEYVPNRGLVGVNLYRQRMGRGILISDWVVEMPDDEAYDIKTHAAGIQPVSWSEEQGGWQIEWTDARDYGYKFSGLKEFTTDMLDWIFAIVAMMIVAMILFLPTGKRRSFLHVLFPLFAVLLVWPASFVLGKLLGIPLWVGLVFCAGGLAYLIITDLLNSRKKD